MVNSDTGVPCGIPVLAALGMPSELPLASFGLLWFCLLCISRVCLFPRDVELFIWIIREYPIC